MHIKRLMEKGLHPSICHDSQQQPESLPDFRGQETDFFCNKFMQGPSPPFHLLPLVSSSPSIPFKDFLCFASFQVLWCLCSPVSETASHRLTCAVFLSLLDGSSLHCSMLEVNVVTLEPTCSGRHLIPDLSSTQMVNPLSLASPQQCSFLQMQGAGDLTAPAFITLWPQTVEKCWLEGKVLGGGKFTRLGQCLLFGSFVTSHSPHWCPQALQTLLHWG